MAFLPGLRRYTWVRGVDVRWCDTEQRRLDLVVPIWATQGPRLVPPPVKVLIHFSRARRLWLCRQPARNGTDCCAGLVPGPGSAEAAARQARTASVDRLRASRSRDAPTKLQSGARHRSGPLCAPWHRPSERSAPAVAVEQVSPHHPGRVNAPLAERAPTGTRPKPSARDGATDGSLTLLFGADSAE